LRISAAAASALNDIEIDYVTAGQGPPLLLLRRFLQSLVMWAHVAR
jgi:hypothetical protein